MTYPKVGFPHGCIGRIYTKPYTPHYATPSYIGRRSKYYSCFSSTGFFNVLTFCIFRPVKLWIKRSKYLPYARHHKPLLNRSRSWIQAIHKDRIFWKNLLKNKEMVFGNGVKNIQAAAYNGRHSVDRRIKKKLWKINRKSGLVAFIFPVLGF